MRRADAKMVVSLVIVVSAISCGGGGEANPTGGIVHPLTGTMSVTPALIDPGQAVTLTWTSRNADGEVLDNIGTFTGHGPALSGSQTYHPTLSETYVMSLQRGAIFGDPPQQVDLSATVTVRPTAQQYLVVGSSSDHSVIAAVTALQGISTKAVIVQTMIPAPSADVDAILIDQSGLFGPSDVPTVRAYLLAGKGVILVRAAPRMLATGDPNNAEDNNVAAIQSWFGGGPTLYTAFGNTHALPGTYVPVPITLVNSRRYGIGPIFDIGRVNPGADPVAGNNLPFMGNPNDLFITAFGYRPSDGGRLYYQANTSFLDDPILLAAGARWAATGP